MKIVNFITLLLIIPLSMLYSQDELLQKKKLLEQKQSQLINAEQKISIDKKKNSEAKEYLTTLEKKQKDKQFDYENKKNAFERASKNVDLVSAEKINQLSNEYKLADKELREIDNQLNAAQLKEQETAKKLEQSNTDKKVIEEDILNLKADIFDIQLREPVWTIGESICNLAENETPDQCRKRALEAAQRDAMEKAGKMVLESETIVKNYKLYLDEIRTHIKAQILEQDNDPQYGINREIVGDNIRYVARLRIKVQSISQYNPYREQFNMVEAGKSKLIPNLKIIKSFQKSGTIYWKAPDDSKVYYCMIPAGVCVEFLNEDGYKKWFDNSTGNKILIGGWLSGKLIYNNIQIKPDNNSVSINELYFEKSSFSNRIMSSDINPKLNPIKFFDKSGSVYWRPPHIFNTYYIEIPAGINVKFFNEKNSVKLFDNSKSAENNIFDWMPGKEFETLIKVEISQPEKSIVINDLIF